jgi:thiol-disulfide isomerase/thioredoxin
MAADLTTCAIKTLMARSVVLACLVVFGCGREGGGNAAPVTKTNPPSGPDCAKAVAKGPIKWIEDDFAAAVACAQVMNAPIILDLWAPWCHTCIAMQTTVFLDPSFAAMADKFVFAALDTDRESNAAAVAKFSTSAWPTFYVIDPKQQVLARFVGAATLQEFQGFMQAGTRAAAGGIAAADARLLGAERALAARDLDTADEELTAAIAAAPPTWPRRAEALGSLLLTKYKQDEQMACIELADKYMDAVGASAIATNFWSTAVSCAGKREKEVPEKSKEIRERAIAKLRAAIDDPKAPLSVDDRGEALGYLRDALDDAGKKDEAKQVAERLRAHVDEAWAKAPTPFARMAFLWPRAEAYAYLERPVDLVPDFEKLAAELPTEYDPPARIGWLYLRGGKLAEAATWTDKALAMVYGPRKGRLLMQRADIALAAGDRLLERRYRSEAVMLFETLTEGQQQPDALAKAKLLYEEADKAARAAESQKATAAGSGSAVKPPGK